MTSPENPRHSGDFYDNDTTIWDPTDHEQAIEDPSHGPSARLELSLIPDMPLGDGRYYRAGGFYAFGSTHVDPSGKPIFEIGLFPGNTLNLRQEIDMLEEWRLTYESGGDEGITALEAARQQARLDAEGVAFSFRPTDVCGGGKRLEQCETAQAMKIESTDFVDSLQENPDEGVLWTVPAWLGRICVSCSLECGLAIQTNGGKPTGVIKFSNVRPMSSGDGRMEVSVEAYEAIPLESQEASFEPSSILESDMTDQQPGDTAYGTDKIQAARRFYQNITRPLDKTPSSGNKQPPENNPQTPALDELRNFASYIVNPKKDL